MKGRKGRKEGREGGTERARRRKKERKEKRKKKEEKERRRETGHITLGTVPEPSCLSPVCGTLSSMTQVAEECQERLPGERNNHFYPSRAASS
jgi:hypothetical protein